MKKFIKFMTAGTIFFNLMFFIIVSAIVIVVAIQVQSLKSNLKNTSTPITITMEILSENEVDFTVVYDGVQVNFKGEKKGNKISGNYVTSSNIPMELPTEPANPNMKVIEPCITVSDESSAAYKVIYGAGSHNVGVYRKVDDRYLIALGSFYSTRMGEKFILKFKQPDGSMKTIKAMLADQKSDEHTDAKHQYQKYDYSIVEFITATGTEKRISQTQMQINQDFGTLTEIYLDRELSITIEAEIQGDTVHFKGQANNKLFNMSGKLENNKVTVTGMAGAGQQGNGAFIYPLEYTVPVTSPFGFRTHPITGEQLSLHSGADLGAGMGDNILASSSGQVIVARYYGGYGNCVIIQHDNNYYTVYGHCNELLVNEGQMVSQGQVIAKVGTTGRSSGPHLHFEIRKGGNEIKYSVDPFSVLGEKNEKNK